MKTTIKKTIALVLLFTCVAAAGCKDKDKYIPPGFHISTPSPIIFAIGAPYSTTLECAFGEEPYQGWAVTGGSLPPGFTLDSATGVLSGCSMAAGEYHFTVEVSDSSADPQTATKQFTLKIQQAEWTFLVYMNADNDLEPWALTKFDEMENSGGSSERVNFVVQIDRIPDYASWDGDWTGCKRFYVTSDTATETIGSVELGDLGEVNTCSESVLQNFLEWGFGRFPAEKYAVIILDHGMTWKTFSVDNTDGYDRLYMSELRSALEDALSNCSIPAVDFLGLDMCLAATFEAAVELRGICGILAGSAELSTSFVWDYGAITEFMRASPSASAAALSQKIAERFQGRCEENSFYPASFVALDLAGAQQALDAFDACTNSILTGLPQDYMDFAITRSYADTYTDSFSGVSETVDAGDLFYILRHITGDSLLRTELDSFLYALDSMVVASYGSERHFYSTNLSLFFPKTSGGYSPDASLYESLDLPSLTSWDETIQDYHTCISSHTTSVTPSNPLLSSSTVTASSPATFSSDVESEYIADIYFYIFEDKPGRILTYQRTTIHNPLLLPSGRQIEKWNTQSNWSLSESWDARCRMLNDGSIKSPVSHVLTNDIYLAIGQYSNDAGSTWFDCCISFDLDGDVIKFYDYSVSTPYSFEVATGDLFKPDLTYRDKITGAVSHEFGNSMNPKTLRLYMQDVSAGVYYMHFGVSDSIRETIFGMQVNVP